MFPTKIITLRVRSFFSGDQVDLTEASDDMDNVTSANLAALRKEARRLISKNGARLDDLSERLSS